MIKIILFTMNYEPSIGGAAVLLADIARYFSEKAKVTVIAPKVEGYANYDSKQPYKTIRFNLSKRISSLSPLIKIIGAIFKDKPDIILLGHTMASQGVGVILASKIFKVPYIIYSHGNDLHFNISKGLITSKIDRLFRNSILNNASQIYANSTYTRDLLLSIGQNPDKIKVINPCIDTELFNPDVEIEDVVCAHKLQGKKVILTVSRLSTGKNIINVLKALPDVIREVPNLKYLIVGQGPREHILKQLTRELKLEDHVNFIGGVYRKALPPYYCAADVFIMPSVYLKESKRNETFGIVFGEAGACAKPVIAGNIGGIGDIVVHEETGLTVNGENIDEIRAALVKLLVNDAYAKKLGQNGMKMIREKFSPEKVFSRFMPDINKCLNRCGNTGL